MIKFTDLGLSDDLLKGLDDLGFVTPSEIQAEAIPYISDKTEDLIALAQTGTGKTAAFSLPILNKLDPRDGLQAIIICPTRELCMQISEDIKKYSKYIKGLNTTAVYGGERIDIQIRNLKRGTNIVVGTPGRVHDLIRRKFLKLSTVKWVVLDEADEMLDMGFKDDLDAILEQTPDTRQTLLFSATISKSVRTIAKNYMKGAEEIKVGEENEGAKNVTHEYYTVMGRDRFEALVRIIDSLNDVYGIIFCRTRLETQEVADKLKQAGYDADALHGEITQTSRTKIMGRFKRKNISLLVATDVAARGIDVESLTHVINYNLPDQNEAYTHRSGRTGRAGSSGVSITITGPRDKGKIRQLENMIGKTFEAKKVPTGSDILENKINHLVDKIVNIVPEKTEVSDYDGIIDKLKKVKKEDLIKFFIKERFNRHIQKSENSRDINVEAQAPRERINDENKQNLKINIGKKNGLEVKDVFGLLNSNKKTKGIGVGKISLNTTHTIISVEKDKAALVVRSFKNARFRGNVVTIEETDEDVPSGGSRRKRSSRVNRRGGPSRQKSGGRAGGRPGRSGGKRYGSNR